MTDILKKRFRKIIRKHFEDKYPKDYQRMRDMYVMMAFIDSVMDEVEVQDLLDIQNIDQIKVLQELIGNLYDQKWDTKMFPIKSPVTGKTVKVTITLSPIVS